METNKIIFPKFEDFKKERMSQKNEENKTKLTSEYNTLQKKILDKYGVSDITELNDNDLDTFNQELKTEWLTVKKSITESNYRNETNLMLPINEDYVSDTKKWIDKVLDNVTDKGAKDFLNGLKDFLTKNGFLTDAQKKGLAQFAPGNPNNKK